MKRSVAGILVAVALMLALGLVLAVPTAANSEAPDEACEATLYAGQDIDAGTVKVWNDEDTLYVRYETTGDWVVTETHLHVAADLAGIPTNKPGNPIPGHFSNGASYDPPVTEDTFAFDLDGMGWSEGDTLYIAAHAVVDDGEQQESAWADGTRFVKRGNWATYFAYTCTAHGGQGPILLARGECVDLDQIRLCFVGISDPSEPDAYLATKKGWYCWRVEYIQGDDWTETCWFEVQPPSFATAFPYSGFVNSSTTFGARKVWTAAGEITLLWTGINKQVYFTADPYGPVTAYAVP